VSTKNYFKKVFLLITALFEGSFTSFFKDKKSQGSPKTVGINVFLYYFCLMIEGPGCGSGRPKIMDPTDPDADPHPQHCDKF
jgi:hypothetical protein